MPYIPKEARKKYNELLMPLVHLLADTKDNDELSGDMNYVLFCLAGCLCEPGHGGHRSYARMSVVASALNEAEKEFRRRVMVPYECEKIDKNGDVYFKYILSDDCPPVN